MCNSLVWSCEITGQSGLTYKEALEADRRARGRLADFPEALRCPLLLLMQLTRRRKLADARDDIFSFVKLHFFVEEEVTAVVNSKDRSVCPVFRLSFICTILCVFENVGRISGKESGLRRYSPAVFDLGDLWILNY